MCNNIKVIFHNIRYGKLYPMDPMSTLQSNLNMSLIYNLRTGNIIVDSLISVLVTSLIMYALSFIKDSSHSLKKWIPWFWRRKRSTLTITCRRFVSKGHDGDVLFPISQDTSRSKC